MTITDSDRFVRQSELVPQDAISDFNVTIIGVGAIGRPLALLLAALGIRRLQLIDPDMIELHNVTTQGYALSEVGRKKVDSLSQSLVDFDSGVSVTTIADVYRSKLQTGDVVFCCVDSIVTRAAIWRSLSSRTRCWVDGRMLGESIRLLTAHDDSSRRHYLSTLFSNSEAQPGRCTSRSTLYASSIAAGIMVHQFSRWLRGLAMDWDATINLLAGEWTVFPQCSATARDAERSLVPK